MRTRRVMAGSAVAAVLVTMATVAAAQTGLPPLSSGGGTSGGGESTAAPRQLPPILSAAPVPGPVKTGPDAASTEAARGVLEPAAEAVISAEIAGRIVDLPVTEGADFAKGALLVRFDCTLYEAQLAQARAQAAGAKAALDNARSLAKLQSIGVLDVQLAEAKLAEASAAIRLSSATVERCRIEAPYAGRVVRRLAQPAEGVAAGDDLLAIVSDGLPRIRLIVPSTWLAWLMPDMPFDFAVDETGGTVKARVTAIGARVDQVSQTVPVLAAIQGRPTDLLPGMSGTARFDPAARPADPAAGEPVPQAKPQGSKPQ